jgi:hypothetical protein
MTSSEMKALSNTDWMEEMTKERSEMEERRLRRSRIVESGVERNARFDVPPLRHFACDNLTRLIGS